MELFDFIARFFVCCAALSLGLGSLSIPFMLLTLWKDRWEWGMQVGLSLAGVACVVMAAGLLGVLFAALFGGV